MNGVFVLVAYVSASAAVLYAMLMGPTAAPGSPTARLHSAVSSAPRAVALAVALALHCGDRRAAERSATAAMHQLTDRRHPALLLLYWGLMGAAAAVARLRLAALLAPGQGVPLAAAFGAGLAAHAAAAFSDPGTVPTAGDVAALRAVISGFLGASPSQRSPRPAAGGSAGGGAGAGGFSPARKKGGKGKRKPAGASGAEPAGAASAEGAAATASAVAALGRFAGWTAGRARRYLDRAERQARRFPADGVLFTTAFAPGGASAGASSTAGGGSVVHSAALSPEASPPAAAAATSALMSPAALPAAAGGAVPAADGRATSASSSLWADDPLAAAFAGPLSISLGLGDTPQGALRPTTAAGNPDDSPQATAAGSAGVLGLGSGGECRTCAVPKPPRSKHCRVCDRCVRRFDHHCAWINNCVGEDNLRWFHLFLGLHCGLCGYVSARCFGALAAFIDRAGVYGGHFVGRSGKPLRPTPQLAWLFASQAHPAVFGLGVFATLAGAMLVAFWGSHLRHVLRNRTANERHKVTDMRHFLLGRRRPAAEGGTATGGAAVGQEASGPKSGDGAAPGKKVPSKAEAGAAKHSGSGCPDPECRGCTARRAADAMATSLSGTEATTISAHLDHAAGFYGAAGVWRNVVEVLVPDTPAAIVAAAAAAASGARKQQ